MAPEIARDARHRARVDALEDREQPAEVHRFVQRIVDRLAHERMVRSSRSPAMFSRHAAASGNTAASRSSTACAAAAGNLLAAAVPRDSQRV